MPVHPSERMNWLAKLDDKVHFIKEIPGDRPKKLLK